VNLVTEVLLQPAARARFVEQFTIEASAQRMAGLYDRVAGVGARTEARHG
jgi:hypothetical protein